MWPYEADHAGGIPMLEIKSLVKIYRTGEEEVRAVDDISFTVDQGETVAISGASGSGKTTLLNMIGTLDGISSGDIMIDGVSIAGMSEKEKTAYRRRIHFMSFLSIPVHISSPFFP